MTGDYTEIPLTVRDERRKRRKIRAVKCSVYSRIVGYFRPIESWNKGKIAEYKDRKMIDLEPMIDEAAQVDESGDDSVYIQETNGGA